MKDALYKRVNIDRISETEALARALARYSSGKLFRRLNGSKKTTVYSCGGKHRFKIPAWKLAALERKGYLLSPSSRQKSFRVVHKATSKERR